MRLMIAGKTNREIAEICGNSTRTVELHRARIFDKLEVSNAVELVRVWAYSRNEYRQGPLSPQYPNTARPG